MKMAHYSLMGKPVKVYVGSYDESQIPTKLKDDFENKYKLKDFLERYSIKYSFISTEEILKGKTNYFKKVFIHAYVISQKNLDTNFLQQMHGQTSATCLMSSTKNLKKREGKEFYC